MMPTKIVRFDRATCRRVAEIAEQAVRDALAPFGLNVKAQGGSYMEGSYTMKIEAAVVGADGTAMSRDVESFKQLAGLYGFHQEDLGRSFNSGDHTFTVAGLKPSSEKYPVIVEREDGKRFKMEAHRVLAGIGRKPLSAAERFATLVERESEAKA